jgi:hypothetical protein
MDGVVVRYTWSVNLNGNHLRTILSWTKKININYRCLKYDCKKIINNKIGLKVKKIEVVLFNGYVVIVLVVSLMTDNYDEGSNDDNRRSGELSRALWK